MAGVQAGGAPQSDYFSVISKISPHDKVFKSFAYLEELGLNGIQLSLDERERQALKAQSGDFKNNNSQLNLDPNQINSGQ